MQPQDIQALLSEALALDEVYVTGDGSHFQVIAVSDLFAEMSRVKQQQYIYGPLMDKIASYEIHALQIKALTKAQWAREKIFLKPS